MSARLVALALAGLLASAPIAAVEQQGRAFTLSDEELGQCRAGGGCLVMPRAVFADLLRQAAKSCGPTT